MYPSSRVVVSLLLAVAGFVRAPYKVGALPLVPGMDFMQSTVNPTSLDILSPIAGGSPTGFPAMQFTFAQNQTIYGPDGQLYSFPDQASVVMMPSSSLENYTLSTYSAMNFTQMYAETFSETTSAWNGLFTASTSWAFLQALSFQGSTQRSFNVAWATATTLSIELIPAWLAEPAGLFQQAVRLKLSPNPNYEDNIPDWQQFFQSWGIAVPVRALFGGVAGQVSATTIDVFNAQGNTWTSLQASANLWTLISAAGGGGEGAGASAAYLAATSSTSAAFRGGTCTPDSPGCSWTDWMTGLLTNPFPLSVEYTTITPYIALVDPAAANGSVFAIANITALLFLEQLVLPTLQQYIAAFGNIVYGDTALCIAQLPACADSGGGFACCAVTTNGNIPSPAEEAAIVNASTTVIGTITLLEARITTAVSASWISQANMTAIIADFSALTAAWAAGTVEAYCSVQYTASTECGPCIVQSPCGPCTCSSNMWARCQTCSGEWTNYWSCPALPVCSGSSGQLVLEQFTSPTSLWP
jgi:hypothetical protein